MEAAFAAFEAAEPMAITGRIFQSLGFAIVVMFISARLMGYERKTKWFKRREKYSFFNRRGIIGEDINFGYPRTWQGMLIALGLYGVILGGGYWYVCVYGY